MSKHVTSDLGLAVTGAIALAIAWGFGDAATPKNDFVVGLSTSYTVTVVFYFVVVWLPTRRRRLRVKKSIVAHYKQFKLDVLGLILHASGRAWSYDELERLAVPREFGKYFGGDGPESHQRWYDVLNGLNDYYVSQLSNRLELLRSEVLFVLGSIDIDDVALFEFMKRLAEVSFMMSKVKSDYDDQKSWGRFLWGLFSDFDPMVGDVPTDRNLEMLEQI